MYLRLACARKPGKFVPRTSVSNHAETTISHSRLDLMITLHKMRKNAKRHCLPISRTWQIRNDRLKGLIKGIQFLTTTVKAI